MRNYFASIVQNDDFIRASSDEMVLNDSVFNNYDYGNTNIPGINNDLSYSFPDRKQYIFHTTNFTNMLVQYSNNMIVPMRQKTSLRSSYNLHTEFGRQNGEGIYIVDYYTISRQFNNSDIFISSILDYYMSSGNLYPNQLYIKEKVTEKMLSLRSSRTSTPSQKIRIITFIPEEYIAKYGLVYVPTSEVVVGSCRVTHNLVHPSSNTYRMYARTLESDVKNYIEIDLVDTHHDNKPYYIKIGNKIHTILSQQATNDRHPGCIINLYRNQEIVTSDVSEYENMGEKLGIFATPEMAESNSDLGLINESNKLRNDLKRLTLEADKLEQENIKFEKQMEVEMEKLKTTLSSLELENKKINMRNKELEIELEKQKENHKHELKMKEIQLELAIKEKERLDIRLNHDHKMSTLDLLKTLSKAKTDALLNEIDIGKKILDLIHSREKHEQDKELLKIRQRERDFATIGAGVNLASTLLKTLS